MQICSAIISQVSVAPFTSPPNAKVQGHNRPIASTRRIWFESLRGTVGGESDVFYILGRARARLLGAGRALVAGHFECSTWVA
jgi:hypothetical protein